MRLKEIVVPKFKHNGPLGTYVFNDVTVLIDPRVREITPQNFDQYKDEFFLDDAEIERLASGAAQRFLNTNFSAIVKGERALTGSEVEAVISICRVNRSEFSDLIGVDRSMVTKVISGDCPMSDGLRMLLIERLKAELDSPGLSRILLEKIRNKKDSKPIVPISDLNISAYSIAEWMIRFFQDREDRLTNLKLQKLLYYSQGIALAKFGVRLFPEPIFAWRHGPVVRSVYDRYKACGDGLLSVDEDVNVSDVDGSEVALVCLKETIVLFGKYTAWALRNKTHNEAPWLETPQSEPIDDLKIQAYFSKALV